VVAASAGGRARAMSSAVAGALTIGSNWGGFGRSSQAFGSMRLDAIWNGIGTTIVGGGGRERERHRLLWRNARERGRSMDAVLEWRGFDR
jgi:hypothetical protein